VITIKNLIMSLLQISSDITTIHMLCIAIWTNNSYNTQQSNTVLSSHHHSNQHNKQYCHWYRHHNYHQYYQPLSPAQLQSSLNQIHRHDKHYYHRYRKYNYNSYHGRIRNNCNLSDKFIIINSL